MQYLKKYICENDAHNWMTVTNIYETFTGQAVSSTLLGIISVKHHNHPRREVVFTSFYWKERGKKKSLEKLLKDLTVCEVLLVLINKSCVSILVIVY